MQIYLFRHGQSQNNAGGASAHNVPLTDLGHEQVRRAADALANQEKFEALYCSPLKRALANRERECTYVNGSLERGSKQDL